MICGFYTGAKAWLVPKKEQQHGGEAQLTPHQHYSVAEEATLETTDSQITKLSDKIITVLSIVLLQEGLIFFQKEGVPSFPLARKFLVPRIG